MILSRIIISEWKQLKYSFKVTLQSNILTMNKILKSISISKQTNKQKSNNNFRSHMYLIK